MELEIIRMCARAAADPTIGVNVMLDALPLDEDDERPDQLSIYNSVDHGPIARRQIPAEGSGLEFPVLAIYVAGPADLDRVKTTVRDGQFPVSFSHVALNTDSAVGNRNACYSMRAVEHFLTQFTHPRHSALRKRGNVQIIDAPGFKLTPVFQKWDAGIVESTLIVTFTTRDITA